MNEPVPTPEPKRDLEALFGLTRIVYGLMAFGLLFSAGLIAVVAIVIDYVKFDEARGTWLESHFRWQIRTFWFGLLWLATGCVLFLTLILIPLAWLIWTVAAIWVVYRIVKGWLALNDRRALA